jgi:hypothetical protein
VSCAITKPRERGGHSLHWAAEPEKIIIIIIIITTQQSVRKNKTKKYFSMIPVHGNEIMCMEMI